MRQTPIEVLADWASKLSSSDVPPEQRRLARLRVLDTIGLIAAAAPGPAARSLADWSQAHSGAGAATIITTGRSSPPAVAALVHGALAHARDFDDTFPETVVHPGSIVVSTALAVGEARDASFDDLTTAIVLGYELAARLGDVAGRGFHARGFHATSVVGPIAAAGTAGRILGLDASAMADALSLATSMSGGLLAFLGDGGWSKWLHTGWSAHGGITAAELAACNFRGPRQALDHRYGLYASFLGSRPDNMDALSDGLGTTWKGAQAAAKYFPCAHVIQPFIEAALALRAQGLVTAENLTTLQCIVAPWALPIVGMPRETKIAPRNDLEAIASLPFMVAAAIADGRVDLGTLDAAALHRAEVRRLAERVVCNVDEALATAFDGRLEARTTSGATITRDVSSTAPDENRLVAKFRTNTHHQTKMDHTGLERSILREAPAVRAIIASAAVHATR